MTCDEADEWHEFQERTDSKLMMPMPDFVQLLLNADSAHVSCIMQAAQMEVHSHDICTKCGKVVFAVAQGDKGTTKERAIKVGK